MKTLTPLPSTHDTKYREKKDRYTNFILKSQKDIFPWIIYSKLNN